MELEKSKNSDSLFNWLKVLWAPIAGFIGAVTLLLQFNELSVDHERATRA